jgi:hypothetical protein
MGFQQDPEAVVRQASPTVKPVEARLTLSCRCIYVIFFGPKGHFVMNKYLYYWTWNLVIILLLYVWFEHPGHTYGGFVPSFSEWGMTPPQKLRIQKMLLTDSAFCWLLIWLILAYGLVVMTFWSSALVLDTLWTDWIAFAWSGFWATRWVRIARVRIQLL